MNYKKSLLIGLLFTGANTPLHADIIDMPAAEPAPMEAPAEEAPAPEEVPAEMQESISMPASGAPAPTTLPGRGMSMEQVEANFGSPNEKEGRVGDPPISRWVYGSFTVYFEYDKVIHAVAHH